MNRITISSLDRINAETSQSVDALQTEVVTLQREKAEAEIRFQALETDYQQVTLKRLQEVEAGKVQAEQEVANLQQEVTELQQQKTETDQRLIEVEAKALQDSQLLQQEVTQLKQEKEATELRFAQMEKSLVELEKLRTDFEPVIAGAQPVTTIDGLNPDTAAILEDNNITTVRALADSDATRLRELGIHHSTAASLIRKANDKVKPE